MKENLEGCEAEVLAGKEAGGSQDDETQAVMAGHGCEAEMLAGKEEGGSKDDGEEVVMVGHGQVLQVGDGEEEERDDQGVVEQGIIALPRPYTPHLGKEKVKFGISTNTSKEPRALGEEIHGEGDLCGLLERRGLTSMKEGSPPPHRSLPGN